MDGSILARVAQERGLTPLGFLGSISAAYARVSSVVALAFSFAMAIIGTIWGPYKVATKYRRHLPLPPRSQLRPSPSSFLVSFGSAPGSAYIRSRMLIALRPRSFG